MSAPSKTPQCQDTGLSFYEIGVRGDILSASAAALDESIRANLQKCIERLDDSSRVAIDPLDQKFPLVSILKCLLGAAPFFAVLVSYLLSKSTSADLAMALAFLFVVLVLVSARLQLKNALSNEEQREARRIAYLERLLAIEREALRWWPEAQIRKRIPSWRVRLSGQTGEVTSNTQDGDQIHDEADSLLHRLQRRFVFAMVREQERQRTFWESSCHVVILIVNMLASLALLFTLNRLCGLLTTAPSFWLPSPFVWFLPVTEDGKVQLALFLTITSAVFAGELGSLFSLCQRLGNASMNGHSESSGDTALFVVSNRSVLVGSRAAGMISGFLVFVFFSSVHLQHLLHVEAALLQSNVARSFLGLFNSDPRADAQLFFVMFGAAFLAGFSERFVPDVYDRIGPARAAS